jgi:hypothetical protein
MSAREVARQLLGSVLIDPDKAPRRITIGSGELGRLLDGIERAVTEAEGRGARQLVEDVEAALIEVGLGSALEEPDDDLVGALRLLAGQRNDAEARALRAEADALACRRVLNRVLGMIAPSREWLQAVAAAETTVVEMPNGGPILVVNDQLIAWARAVLPIVDELPEVRAERVTDGSGSL